MSKNNLRRTTFLSTIGMAVVGWMGVKSSSTVKVVEPNGLPNAKNDNSRARPDPRAVPCSDRTL